MTKKRFSFASKNKKVTSDVKEKNTFRNHTIILNLRKKRDNFKWIYTLKTSSYCV